VFRKAPKPFGFLAKLPFGGCWAVGKVSSALRLCNPWHWAMWGKRETQEAEEEEEEVDWWLDRKCWPIWRLTLFLGGHFFTWRRRWQFQFQFQSQSQFETSFPSGGKVETDPESRPTNQQCPGAVLIETFRDSTERSDEESKTESESETEPATIPGNSIKIAKRAGAAQNSSPSYSAPLISFHFISFHCISIDRLLAFFAARGKFTFIFSIGSRTGGGTRTISCVGPLMSKFLRLIPDVSYRPRLDLLLSCESCVLRPEYWDLRSV